MSPARVRGTSKHSFGDDMWSLGVTIITVMTGKIPFPTANRNSWMLMNAIISGPQPTLSKEGASSEIHDFIHQCLNQPFKDKACALKLLDHPFLTLARDRGIIQTHKPATLAKCGKLKPLDLPSNASVKKVVEVAISWQLERFEKEINLSSKLSYETSLCNNDLKMKSSKEKILQYLKPQIEWLASQMNVEVSILEDK